MTRDLSGVMMSGARQEEGEPFGPNHTSRRAGGALCPSAGEDRRLCVGRGPEAALDADEIEVSEVLLREHIAAASLAGLEVYHLLPPCFPP